MTPSIPCRLCHAEAEHEFSLDGFEGRQLHYFQCRQCGSLQTQDPDWLDSAYRNQPHVGAASIERANYFQAQVWLLSRILGIPKTEPVLDFGGGAGLLCALLDDLGFTSWLLDAWDAGSFATRKASRVDRAYGIVCAIEVWEHLRRPAEELAALLAFPHRGVLVGTNLWAGQGPAWDYLNPGSGQHVFFYSAAAMQWIARRFGLHAQVFAPNGTVFTRTQPSVLQRTALRGLGAGTKAVQIALAGLPRHAPER